MRPYGLVLAALLLAGVAAAQQAPPAAPPAPAPDALDNYLLRWEQEMQKVQTLAAQLVRVDRDKTFNTTTRLAGYAAYMKAGTGPTALNLAMMQLGPEAKPEQVQEKFICTGTFVYAYAPAQKEIKVYELPKPRPGQVAEDNVFSFMFGMQAGEARRRYDLRLAKEDKYYIYVDVLPRSDRDKTDFQRARLVLNKDNYLPRQLWFEHPNGNEVTWDIPRIQNGAQLDRRLFDKPATPEGWRMVQVPLEAEGKPRVYRATTPP
jgi:TIGR03009 family protein